MFLGFSIRPWLITFPALGIVAGFALRLWDVPNWFPEPQRPFDQGELK